MNDTLQYLIDLSENFPNRKWTKVVNISASRRPPVQPIQCDRWRSNIPIQIRFTGLVGTARADGR